MIRIKVFFILLINLFSINIFNNENNFDEVKKTISISAVKYQFIPDKIILKMNEKVELDILAEDVDHGFCSKELDIYLELPVGDEIKYIFTPKKKGEFEFYCCVYCGINHKKMKGKIIVQE